METTESHSLNDEQCSKKGRHRKKQLYNSILQQMEFYFSDSNLTKDRFLSKLITENPYVDLNVFLKFNKIRKLTTKVEDLQKALKNSNLIELSEDKASICRKEPINVKTNVDECTIYVERLKSETTIEWLNSVFSEFGNVVYVSLPKYKHNGVVKGFAFIEFDKEEEAEKALNYFDSIGCKMPSNIEPDELCSIATFENNQDTCKNDELEQKEDEKGTKRKIEEEENQENGVKKLKTESGETSESEDADTKKKKKKKDNKKKNFVKDLGLQVLSKKEWKKMRNRYLEMQRKKMKEFKQHLFRAKFVQKKNEKEKEVPAEKEAKLEFTEGVIVKIKLPEPVSDLKKSKNEIKNLSSDIQYVDVPNVGSDEIYIRCKSKESAENFSKLEFPGVKEVLTGDEEKAYWKKINEERDKKLAKTNKKMRGRDKLLKKAKHIKFDSV